MVYGELDQWLVQHGARDVAMLTEFMTDCLTDLRKWSDPVLKTAVAESEENKALIQGWIDTLLPEVTDAFSAWSNTALETASIDNGLAVIAERSKKAGLTLELDSVA